MIQSKRSSESVSKIKINHNMKKEQLRIILHGHGNNNNCKVSEASNKKKQLKTIKSMSKLASPILQMKKLTKNFSKDQLLLDRHLPESSESSLTTQNHLSQFFGCIYYIKI